MQVVHVRTDLGLHCSHIFVDAQADLSLRWIHVSECTISVITVHKDAISPFLMWYNKSYRMSVIGVKLIQMIQFANKTILMHTRICQK